MRNGEKAMLSKIKQSLARFVDAEEGQSTTEYILILSIVVLIAMKMKGTLQTKLVGIVEKVTGQIDSATNE